MTANPGSVISTRHAWSQPPHSCYWCNPQDFPPVPSGCALCARCGALMVAANAQWWKNAMEVCAPCEEELADD